MQITDDLLTLRDKIEFARFWMKVAYDQNGCWLWKGSLSNQGYGYAWRKKKPRRAHRIAFESIYGCPSDDKVVMHLCDVRACVRPDHLRLGTPLENNQDKVFKNRHAHGDTHGMHKHPEKAASGEQQGLAKLTWAIVDYIRSQNAKRPQNQSIWAKRYGVNSGTISLLLRGKTWKKQSYSGNDSTKPAQENAATS